MSAVTMPNMPSGPSAWVSTSQWKAHTPKLGRINQDVDASPGATSTVSS